MATRSTIALEYADGTVDQIYCHWDGYISHNGRILQEHYLDPFKVQKLMDLGHVSSLGPEIGEAHDFDELCKDSCTFYGRDRGETECESHKFKNFEDYINNHDYEEYDYILRTNGQWYVSQYKGAYKLLTAAMIKEKKMIKVITNSHGSGDWIVVEDSNTGEIIFRSHRITPHDLVEILTFDGSIEATLVEVTDEHMEENYFWS